MARTIAERKQQILDAVAADPDLSPYLTSTSAAAMFDRWAYVVADCEGDVDALFDLHKAEVLAILATQRPHTLPWYAGMAKMFQYGVTLPPDTDVYPDPAPAGSLIIDFAAAVELTNLVRIKVANLSGGVLGPITSPQLAAFSTYMNRIKDAGVRLQLTSGDPDNLQLKVDVYYDPLVLDNTGARLDGTNPSPVKDAINFFLDNLPFNGVFITDKLIAYIEENVEGVKIFDVTLIQANYGFTAFVPFHPDYTPDAGYMVLDAPYFDAHVTYIPRP
jgi:hypothetical protein